MKTHDSILAHGQRRLVCYSPKGHRELDMTEHTHTQTHVSIYIIYFFKRYHGVARVGHDLVTKPPPPPPDTLRDIWLI